MIPRLRIQLPRRAFQGSIAAGSANRELLSMNEGPEKSIHARAYEIWEKEGRPEGRDQDHWLRAEQEIAGKSSVESPMLESEPTSRDAASAEPAFDAGPVAQDAPETQVPTDSPVRAEISPAATSATPEPSSSAKGAAPAAKPAKSRSVKAGAASKAAAEPKAAAKPKAPRKPKTPNA